MRVSPKKPKSFGFPLLSLNLLDSVLKQKQIREIGITSRRELLICLTLALESKWEKLATDMRQPGRSFRPGATSGVLHTTDIDERLDRIVNSKAGVELALGTSQTLIMASLRHLTAELPQLRQLDAMLDITLADLRDAFTRFKNGTT